MRCYSILIPLLPELPRSKEYYKSTGYTESDFPFYKRTDMNQVPHSFNPDPQPTFMCASIGQVFEHNAFYGRYLWDAATNYDRCYSSCQVWRVSQSNPQINQALHSSFHWHLRIRVASSSSSSSS